MNKDKCHLVIAEHKCGIIPAKIGLKNWQSNKQKLIKIEINKNLSFDEDVSNLIKKAGRKLSVFAKLSSYIRVKQSRIWMKVL